MALNALLGWASPLFPGLAALEVDSTAALAAQEAQRLRRLVREDSASSDGSFELVESLGSSQGSWKDLGEKPKAKKSGRSRQRAARRKEAGRHVRTPSPDFYHVSFRMAR